MPSLAFATITCQRPIPSSSQAKPFVACATSHLSAAYPP